MIQFSVPLRYNMNKHTVEERRDTVMYTTNVME